MQKFLTGDLHTLTVTATRSAGAGTLQGATAVAAVGGVAAYANLSHQVATNITLQFTSGSLTAATSSTIAVSAATATVVQAETAANGSGTVVPTQNVPAGNSITNYAITRDSYGNFIANAAADAVPAHADRRRGRRRPGAGGRQQERRL